MNWVTWERIQIRRTAIAWIVRSLSGADRKVLGAAPECPGLLAISRGFPLIARDERETMATTPFLYDALYPSLEQRRAE